MKIVLLIIVALVLSFGAMLLGALLNLPAWGTLLISMTMGAILALIVS